MTNFTFADFLLLFVTLAITFAILYLVEKARKSAREKRGQDTATSDTTTKTDD